MSSKYYHSCKCSDIEINSSNVAGLSPEYEFELIPDCSAATEAGYKEADRKKAQLWYAPVINGKYFYYVAWSE